MRVALNRQVARFIGRDIPKSYLGNAARKQKRIRLGIKRGRSSGVVWVAVRHEHYQPLPRPGEQDAIRVQEVKRVRFVGVLLPLKDLYFMRRQPDANQHPSRRQARAIPINNQVVTNTFFCKLTPLNVRVCLKLGGGIRQCKINHSK